MQLINRRFNFFRHNYDILFIIINISAFLTQKDINTKN